ncbi:hypothetical protein ACN28S_30585 [Cystobacter fuscus]
MYFQWWRYRPDSHDWAPEPAVRIFNADDSTAYTRALLARDSRGRLWVQAFRLEEDGGSTAVLSVSSDEGASFQRQANLGRVKRRGGGRLLSVGSKLVFLYAMHDGFEPTRMRIRRDGDPVESWGDVKTAFSDGIYHGAALSAVADGEGGMHLVYKDETERLYYRHFDGTSFGSRTLLESSRDWAMQAAITRVGKTLYVFYNVMRSADRSYELHARTLKEGRFSDPVVLDSKRTFKGYPNALETLSEGVDDVPCFFGEAPDNNSRGNMVRVKLDGPGGGGSESPPPTEPSRDIPSPGRELFRDGFSRNASSGLGSDWSLSGLWLSNGRRAVSDLDNSEGNNQALASPSRCRDCRWRRGCSTSPRTRRAWCCAPGETRSTRSCTCRRDASSSAAIATGSPPCSRRPPVASPPRGKGRPSPWPRGGRSRCTWPPRSTAGASAGDGHELGRPERRGPRGPAHAHRGHLVR